MNLTSKVALVTGAGSGIGRRSSIALLKAGYSVVLAGRRVEMLEATAKEAGNVGSRALVACADVTDSLSVRALFAKTIEHFSRLDLLFNNAGVSAPGVPPRGINLRPVESRFGHEPDGRIFVHAGSIQDHEEPASARRTDHQ